MSNIWDEDLGKALEERGVEVEAARALKAISEARDAFWAKIAESFPEVTHGDMAPGDEMAFEFASNEVALTWLGYNHPSVT